MTRFAAGFVCGAASVIGLIAAQVWRALADRDPYR